MSSSTNSSPQCRRSSPTAASSSRTGPGPTRSGCLPVIASGSAASTTISRVPERPCSLESLTRCASRAGSLPNRPFCSSAPAQPVSGSPNLLTQAMILEGVSAEQARARIWLFNRNGLVESDAQRPYRRAKAIRSSPRADQGLRRRDRVDQADRHHRRQHRGEEPSASGHRSDGADQPAPDHLRAFESDVALRVLRGRCLPMVGGSRRVR